jgi:hypothetical protein
MSEEHEGIRGDELADEDPSPTPPPEAPTGGVRGDELADAAGGVGEPAQEQLAEDSPRGDGLADDAA